MYSQKPQHLYEEGRRRFNLTIPVAADAERDLIEENGMAIFFSHKKLTRPQTESCRRRQFLGLLTRRSTAVWRRRRRRFYNRKYFPANKSASAGRSRSSSAVSSPSLCQISFHFRLPSLKSDKNPFRFPEINAVIFDFGERLRSSASLWWWWWRCWRCRGRGWYCVIPQLCTLFTRLQPASPPPPPPQRPPRSV